ncbi:MAG: putative rane protein [Herbinix sp.]|jgi:hypothetical protein|nr:putative rane protein [Herbinix sp.]
MTKETHSFSYYILNSHRPDNATAIIKERLLLMLYLAGIYLFFSLVHIGCPLKFTSGISCPGCGMTRAYYSLFQLDLYQAFHYHPLFILVPLMTALYLFDFYFNPRLVKVLWTAIIIAFLATYLIRLFISQSNVVEIDISSGIMIKLYQLIIGGR